MSLARPDQPPLNRTSCAKELQLYPCPNPDNRPCATPVGVVLSPNLRAQTGGSGSTTATKCVSPPATLAPFQAERRIKEKRPARSPPKNVLAAARRRNCACAYILRGVHAEHQLCHIS